MGLDIFASRLEEEISLTDADLRAFSEAGIGLCGGLFSGAPGSFRGKIYDTLLLDIICVSLYQPWIPPETVRAMYAALLSCDPSALLESYQAIYADLDQEYHGDSLEELTEKIVELRKFFGVCTERGLGLIGDY
jgi:hypothetical protein